MAQTKEQLRRLREKYHLGEYSHRRGKSSSTRRTRRKSGKGRIYMARRKRGHRRSGGGKKIFGLSTKGLIPGLGIMGLAAGILFADEIANMVPVDIPYKNYAVSFALGGPAGVVGKVAKDKFMPGGIGGSGGALL